MQDREFVDMDLPFNGVNLMKRQGSTSGGGMASGERPESPQSVDIPPNCFPCCPRKEDKIQKQHAVTKYVLENLKQKYIEILKQRI